MLEKLRAKSEHTRKTVSLVLTIAVFGGILFVWLSSWDAQQSETDVREKTASPLASFTTMIDGLVLSVKDAFSNSPSFVETNGNVPVSTTASSTASTSTVDLSGVVIIDPAASTSTQTVHP